MVTAELSVPELTKRTNDCCAALLAGLKKLSVDVPLAFGVTSALKFVRKPSGVLIRLCTERSNDEAIVNLHLPVPSPILPVSPLAALPFSRS